MHALKDQMSGEEEEKEQRRDFMSSTKQHQQPTSAAFFIRLFIPFALAFFMSCLLRTINSVLSPTFIETFHMSASNLGMMTSAYFLSFAIAQIPLGVCLDRYGPGRTLSGFMLFGVLGCVVFAAAPSVTFLFIGRALVGLGVSGCLMAAYKAFGDWLPKEKLPMYNSLESFVGGVGGMVATTPINAALGFISWRGVFLALGGLTLGVAILLFFSPRHPDEVNVGENIQQQFKGTLKIAVSGKFWRLAPIAVFGQAIYLALNSLWIGPWYRDVFHSSPENVPNLLFICSFAITIGYLINGFVANFLKAKIGMKVINVTLISMSIYTVVLGLIVIFPQYGNILWPVFVFLGPFSLLTYPIFSSMFDAKLAGRVQTTYNMLVFIMSTVIQSGVGWIIDMYEPMADGSYNPQGYKVALIVLVAALALSIIWCLFYRKDKDEIQY
ncbi:MAG TPA: hypothetical protein DCZ20_09380 [Lachnospiraceae bacterium]|nr:hypothetical protein [Lachnospiraceae bacterium]